MDIIEIINISFLVGVLVVAVITDVRSHKIPNWLTYSAMMMGIGHHAYMNGFQGFLFAISGLLVGTALFLPFYFAAGMGAGDVKLLGSIGTLIGMQGVFMSFICTVIVGGIYAIILLTMHGYLMETVKRYALTVKTFLLTRNFLYIPPENSEKRPLLCYGVAIAIGTMFSLAIKQNALNALKALL